jgi:hypothetical protein
MTADVAHPIDVRPVETDNNFIKPSKTASDRMPPRPPDVFVDVTTAPHIGTPGEANWQEFELSRNMFPGGAATADAKARDPRHIEYNGQLKDSFFRGFFTSYNTQFSGRDVKDDDGRLLKREVSFNYQESGANIGKNLDIAGPDKKPLQGVSRYELNYNSADKAYDVEFHTVDGRVHTGQTTGFADLKNIKWDDVPDLNRKFRGRSNLTPPNVATPGTAQFENDVAEAARQFPGGPIENVRLLNNPKDVEYLAYKGNFKDGYLNNLIWPTNFEGYDVKDKSGNLIKRNVNMSYVDWNGKELGKSMPDVLGPNGQPLSGVTNYQLLYDRNTGGYNVKFKLADGNELTARSSWAGLENLTWINANKKH